MAKLLRQPYTVPRACMLIRALPVLTGDGLTCAETFLDTGMHLTPSVTPAKQWRPVTGATYIAASVLIQTAQSLSRGTVRGILAERVALTWAAHVDTCATVLAVSAQRTWFWFHHSVRVTPPSHTDPAAHGRFGTGAALCARPHGHGCPGQH